MQSVLYKLWHLLKEMESVDVLVHESTSQSLRVCLNGSFFVLIYPYVSRSVYQDTLSVNYVTMHFAKCCWKMRIGYDVKAFSWLQQVL